MPLSSLTAVYGSYEVDAGESDLEEGEEIDFDIDYTAQKTFFEADGKTVAGTSTASTCLV